MVCKVLHLDPSTCSCTIIVHIIHCIMAYYSASCVIRIDASVYFASNVVKQWYLKLSEHDQGEVLPCGAMHTHTKERCLMRQVGACTN